MDTNEITTAILLSEDNLGTLRRYVANEHDHDHVGIATMVRNIVHDLELLADRLEEKRSVEHRYAGDDRCACGNIEVYYDGDGDGPGGFGCEVGGYWTDLRRRYVGNSAAAEQRLTSWFGDSRGLAAMEHLRALYSDDGRLCIECGADVIGNDPHSPDCPTERRVEVHCLGPNLHGDHDFHVHAAGCADVERSPLYRSPEFARDRSFTYSVGSLLELSAEIYADVMTDDPEHADPANYLDTFKVFPCAGSLR